MGELYRYLADVSTAEIADRYVALIDYCLGLAVDPIKGTVRDDIRPGLLPTSDKKRTMIAFVVAEDVVLVLDIFHGGCDDKWTLAIPERVIAPDRCRIPGRARHVAAWP